MTQSDETFLVVLDGLRLSVCVRAVVPKICMGSTFAFLTGRFKHASRDASSKVQNGSGSSNKELSLEHRIPPRLEMLMDMPPVSKDIQIKHAWNSDDR